ncbi:MAG: SGNH/GDSL hydrolase family protein [Xanthomonadaceae bacterium]|nr:SGNH/GDSL hydrolase family protein [Xanthomonadaceae bacterium]
MRMLLALLFWLSFALLAPLLLLQAAWVTRTARRLPAGDGSVDGTVAGGGAPLSVLFVGESPVAGIGCDRMEQAVAACTARELARLTGRAVRWHAAGVNGLRIRQTLRYLVAKLPDERFDFIVGVHGVNDTTGLSSIAEWRRLLSELALRLTERHRGAVIYTQVAPMHLFTGLPQPLRAVIGLRARVLDMALHAHPDRGHLFEVIDAEFPLDARYLAKDGYHPSPAGCAVWGRQLGAALAARLR